MDMPGLYSIGNVDPGFIFYGVHIPYSLDYPDTKRRQHFNPPQRHLVDLWVADVTTLSQNRVETLIGCQAKFEITRNPFYQIIYYIIKTIKN